MVQLLVLIVEMMMTCRGGCPRCRVLIMVRARRVRMVKQVRVRVRVLVRMRLMVVVVAVVVVAGVVAVAVVVVVRVVRVMVAVAVVAVGWMMVLELGRAARGCGNNRGRRDSARMMMIGHVSRLEIVIIHFARSPSRSS